VKPLAVITLAFALAVAIWFWPRAQTQPGALATVRARAVTPVPARPDGPAPSSVLIGQTILADYAKPSLPPENDLILLSHLMGNFTLLVKSADTRPLSANEDWARALRGGNPSQERFLPDQHPAFNSLGQLVDRWGTPLFFHALGAARFDIRSAGPDRRLWTADDLQLDSDGSIRHGPGL
jgi:hypothetical protein